MEFVKLKKEEDLEMVKSLVDYKEYFESDNIMWDRSVKCIANNGDLLGFALIKPNSLFDFFGGDIPPEIGVPENEKLWIKEDLEYFKDEHYEVLYFVKTIGDNYKVSDDINDSLLQVYMCYKQKMNDDGSEIGVLWSKIQPPTHLCHFYYYNDCVYLDIPRID